MLVSTHSQYALKHRPVIKPPVQRVRFGIKDPRNANDALRGAAAVAIGLLIGLPGGAFLHQFSQRSLNDQQYDQQHDEQHNKQLLQHDMQYIGKVIENCPSITLDYFNIQHQSCQKALKEALVNLQVPAAKRHLVDIISTLVNQAYSNQLRDGFALKGETEKRAGVEKKLQQCEVASVPKNKKP